MGKKIKKFLILLSLPAFFSAGLLSGKLNFINAQGTPGSTGPAPPTSVAIPPGLPAEIDLPQCAFDVTNYMNTVLDQVAGNVRHAKLLSPSFNLTSHFEWPLYLMMREYGAKFNLLDFMSGNTYTRYNPDGTPSVTAFEFYNGGAGFDWRNSFGGKPMIFTEYGDFATKDLGISSYRPEHISGTDYSMKKQFELAVSSGAKVLYFSPFPGNAQFDFHNINEPDLINIIAANPSAAGANSSKTIDTSGAFATKVSSLGMRYVLEIITAPEAAKDVISYINNLPSGVVPVIRSCWGNSCGLDDPNELAKLILEVDSSVNREWYVIVGPNEPLTDPWVSPACGDGSTAIPAGGGQPWEWKYISCDNTTDPEFHSLRPYPASPCPPSPDSGGKILMCGNSIIAEQEFKIDFDEINPDSNSKCVRTTADKEVVTYTDAAGIQRTREFILDTYFCEDIIIESEVQATINLEGAELPVLGNTEDVPNANSRSSSLTYAQRVNNYVTWYLNGVLPTAEEEFVSGADHDSKELLSYAGPIQKLYPSRFLLRRPGINYNFFTRPAKPEYIQIDETLRTHDRLLFERIVNFSVLDLSSIGNLLNFRKLIRRYLNRHTFSFLNIPQSEYDERHNQIVVCGNRGLPEACYTRQGQDRLRKQDVRNIPGDLTFSYIPFASTEDTLAAVRVVQSTYGQPNSDIDILEGKSQYKTGGNLNPDIKHYDELYVAHARGANQLTKLLQSTYIPDSFDSDSISGMPPLDPTHIGIQTLPFCTIVDTYSSPGDDFHGELTYEDFSCDGPVPPGASCDNTRATEARNIKTSLDYEAEADCEIREELDINGFLSCVSPREVENNTCMPASSCSALGGTDSGGVCSVPGFVSCYYTTIEPPLVDEATCAEEHVTTTDCRITARTAFDVHTEWPYLERIFNRLVYGNMSFYRRIFPRLNANNKSLPARANTNIAPGPLDLIENIPAETNVSYETTTLSSDAFGFDIELVGDKTFAGDPAKRTPGSNAKLYIPYLGTIHKYFLSGVQCAYRPAGVGCENSSLVSETEGSSPSINCNPNAPEPNLGRWRGRIVPRQTWQDWANSGFQPFSDLVSIENIALCYNDIVGRAVNAGYDPAFVLAIWAEESWASNYEELEKVGLMPVADMGCTVGYSRNNFEHQLRCMENLLYAYTDPSHWSYDDSQGMQCRDGDNCTSYGEWLLLFAEGRQGCREGKYDDNPDFLDRIFEYYRITSGGNSLNENAIMRCAN